MKEQLETSLDRIDASEDVWEQASEVQETLTEQTQHRSASIPVFSSRRLPALMCWRSCTMTATSTPSPGSPSSPPGGSGRLARCSASLRPSRPSIRARCLASLDVRHIGST